MKITKIFAFMLAAACLATSCSDDDNTTPGKPAVIPPLEYFTLNISSARGLTPGISNYEVEGSILNIDLFKSANNEQLLENPKTAMIIDGKLIVACGDNFSSPKGAIEILDAETLVREMPRIDFSDLAISSFTQIDDDKILVVGSNNSGNNVVTVNIKTGEITEICKTKFNIQYAFAADDKVLIYGNIPGGFNMDTYTPIPESFHFALFDEDNISEAGMREVLVGEQAYAVSSIIKFLEDKSEDDNIWIPLKNSDDTAKVICFDTEAESVISSFTVPNTSYIETTNFSLTNSNDGKHIYVRVAEAIYDYNITANAINPDPMVSFNYSAGYLRDLEMTKEGKFLFIDQDGNTKGGQVFEISKGDDGVWTKSEDGVMFEGIAPNDIILK